MNKIYECKINSMTKEQKRSNIRILKMRRFELVECKHPVSPSNKKCKVTIFTQ